MTTLLWQTFLVLLGSFFTGCAVACLFRRLFTADTRRADAALATAAASARTAPAPVVPARPAVAPAPSKPLETTRFERALSGDAATGAASQQAPTRTAPGPVVEVSAPPPKLTPPTPAAQPLATAQPAPLRPAPAPSPAAAPAAASPRLEPTVTPLRPVPPPATATPSAAPIPAAPPSATAAAASLATAAAAAAAAAAARPSAPPPAAPVPAAPASVGTPATAATAAATGPADDLTRIRAIDKDMEARLNRLGVRRFSDIAWWTAGDVNRMSQSLGFKGRIEQENWIEQAQILAKGGETDYSRRRSMAASVATTTASPAAAASSPATAKSAASDGGAVPFGVAPRSLAAEAASAAAAAALSAAASSRSAASPAAPEKASAPVTPATAPALAATQAPASPSLAQQTPGAGDRLHRILGINAEAERLLVANGVTRFTQIAAWTPADVDRFDLLIGRPGRIARENWIEQAKVLARSADDTGNLSSIRAADAVREPSSSAAAPASSARGDVSQLRSVRSEALRSGVTSEPTARAGGLTRPIGGFEDLKRIRGVGVLIEKKLNSLGIASYEQIANWTGADIDRISHILDFKGRIERENWVEQARILAAGGHTEFSRRVDRGDVDSSKPSR